MGVNVFICILLAVLPTTSLGFDQVDRQIFDLYEEVCGTFYEFLGVQKDASPIELKRAYRKLSLVLHPDKNKAANAQEQFIQLGEVYAILMDEEKRENFIPLKISERLDHSTFGYYLIYNKVLKNGLPDGRRQRWPIRCKFYKMGNPEVLLIVLVMLTIVNFLTWWEDYLQKKFEMEEILAPVGKGQENKKVKVKLNGGQDDEDVSMEKVLGHTVLFLNDNVDEEG